MDKEEIETSKEEAKRDEERETKSQTMVVFRRSMGNFNGKDTNWRLSFIT